MPALRFTDRKVNSLARPASGQVDYYDRGQDGLVLRVSYGGTKTWFARYRVSLANGMVRRRRKKLGTYPAMKLADARKEMRAVLYQRDQGEDPAVVRAELAMGATVRDMAAAYLEAAKLRKRSWRKDEAMLNHDILPIIGDLAPRDVSRADIQFVLDRMRARKVTVQINRVFEVMRAMFNWGLATYVEVSPAYGLKKPVKERPRERTLSHAELRSLWRLIEEGGRDAAGTRASISKPVQLALKLLLVTGQRVSEVARAPKSEFDLEARVWTIPGRRAKNGRTHRVPLSDMAIELIEEAIAEFDERKRFRKVLEGRGTEWLFPGWRGRYGYDEGTRPVGSTALNHALRRVLAVSDLEDIRPHDFRRVVATELAGLHVPEAHIAAVLNHVRAGVTRRHYNQYPYEKEKREALDLWAERLQGILASGELAEVLSIKKDIA